MMLHSLLPFDALLPCGGALAMPPPLRCGERLLRGSAESVEETDAGWLLRVPLPGKAPADVTVEVVDSASKSRTLRIRAPQRAEDKYALPPRADAEGLSASLLDGILTVAIPKAAPPAPVEVPVAEAAAPAVQEAGADAASAAPAPRALTLPCPGFGASALTVKAHTAAETPVLEVTGGKGQAGSAFRRVLALGRDFSGDAAAIAAYCQHGLLTVHVPRAAPPAAVAVPLSGEALEEAAEEGARVVLRAPLPGVAAGDLTARVAAGGKAVVVETAPAKAEGEGAKRRRRHSFVRLSAALPPGTAPEGVRGSLKDGLLTVVAPPAPTPAARALPLNTAAHAAL